MGTVSWPSNRPGEPLDWGFAKVGTCAWKEETWGLTKACIALRVCGCVKWEGGDGIEMGGNGAADSMQARVMLASPYLHDGPQVSLPILPWS